MFSYLIVQNQGIIYKNIKHIGPRTLPCGARFDLVTLGFENACFTDTSLTNRIGHIALVGCVM